jgi:hypothetical protein
MNAKRAKTPHTASQADRAQLRITSEEARQVADLLRYAVSLNTTAGLVSPTQRRLATTTYNAVEIAALILEGKTFDEAIAESSKSWTGSLEEDHRHALELLQQRRDALREAMSDRLPPEQLTEFLEISEDQFLELIRPDAMNRNRATPES